MKNLFYLLIIILCIISYQQLTAPNNSSAIKEKTVKQNINEKTISSADNIYRENQQRKQISQEPSSNIQKAEIYNQSKDKNKISYNAELYMNQLIEANLDRDMDKARPIWEKLLEEENVKVTNMDTILYCPRNPELPSITINGKTYTGKICVKIEYIYNNNSFEAGKCRNWVKED